MAVAEAAILQQVFGRIHLVQFFRDVTALGAGNQQFLAAIMHCAVDVPQADMLVRCLFREQGAFQSNIVTGHHREAVQR